MRFADNPLLFAVQLFGLLRTVYCLCLEHTVVDAANHEFSDFYCHDAGDQRLAPPIRPPLHSTSTSAEAGTQLSHGATPCGTSIKGHPLEYATTGHGGTERMRFADNPLLFAVQLFGLLRTVYCLCLEHTVVDAANHQFSDFYCHDAGDQRLAPPIRPPLHSTSTSAEAGTQLSHGATPCGTSIKGHPLEYATTGHGGTERMRFADNPLLFAVQLFGLLRTVYCLCLEHTVVDAANHEFSDFYCHDAGDQRLAPPIRPPLHSTSTSAEAGTQLSHGATPCGTSIKGHPLEYATTGHGGTERMRFADNPLLFAVQVRKYYGKCYRSSDPFLLVLPCPWLCCLLDIAVICLRKLLLLGGDIETNPGPDTAQILKQLREIAADIKDIKENRLVEIEKKVDALSNLEEKVTSCQDRLSHMNQVVLTHERKIDDLENHSRRPNLVIFRLPQPEGENSGSLETAVNKGIFHDLLELEPVAIERIHRLGRPSPNKNRPVILRLLDTRDKTLIFKQCHKLKNTAISISEDYSQKVCEVRRKLWASAKENRERGDKVSLAFDKLYINNVAYVWNEEINDRVAAQKTTKEIHAAQ
ncbi:uncharacterized protein LOC125756943 [Rhipicephalus sanguineus]|uniref:uncharacterized protein LOC125756943 n=1 Tax=Rhipicephalus sanguineus TaxID=34632 RepID=UPI0020C318E4|nr:uncharacterized protein LOC125756943 [Rhipicephalus sanguineus]